MLKLGKKEAQEVKGRSVGRRESLSKGAKNDGAYRWNAVKKSKRSIRKTGENK